MIKKIAFVIIILIILSYFGINIRSVIDNPLLKENLNYIAGLAQGIWENYLRAPLEWLWDNYLSGFASFMWKSFNNLFYRFNAQFQG